MVVFSLPPAVFRWLHRMHIVGEHEIDGPPSTGDIALTRDAAGEFENGVRVARLLQLLLHGEGMAADSALETIKELHTPVARLYNWNILLPLLKQRGVEVDSDMKVLIVAGDDDIVVDVLNQLHSAGGAAANGSAAANPYALNQLHAAPAPAPLTKAVEATCVSHFFAFCCTEQLGYKWPEALELVVAPGHAHLTRLLHHGTDGDFTAAVRWFKLIFVHCKHLAALCAADPADMELSLSITSGGLCSVSADVALWSSRLLCRLATDLTQHGKQAALWPWFSRARPAGGAAALLDAWRAHPELHAIGSLLPLVLHFSGDKLDAFLSIVLPRHATSHSVYTSFVLELLPLLASSDGMLQYMQQTGTLKLLVQRAMQDAHSATNTPSTRSLALELLAQLWMLFARELQAPLETSSADVTCLEAEGAVDLAGPAPKDVASKILSELKRGCRDADFEVQLTAHMALFRLLDHFASSAHPAAPVLFKVLAFSLIENHHDPVMRQFLARNMQHTLQHQPYIPVGVLLKPLVKQATLYGYNNCDFDFFLTLAKHQRLGLRHALLLMQFLGKVCLNDALHGRVATIPFLVLVERFHASEVLHDFLEIFVEQALGTLLPSETGGKKPQISSIRSTLCIELVAKLLHLPHTTLLSRITPAVRLTSEQYSKVQGGVDHPGLSALLHFSEKNNKATSLQLPAPARDDIRAAPVQRQQPPVEEEAPSRPQPPAMAHPPPLGQGKGPGGAGGYARAAQPEARAAPPKPARGRAAPPAEVVTSAVPKLPPLVARKSPPPPRKSPPPPAAAARKYAEPSAAASAPPRKVKPAQVKQQAKVKYDAKLKQAKAAAAASSGDDTSPPPPAGRPKARPPAKPPAARPPPSKPREPELSSAQKSAEEKRQRGQAKADAERERRKEQSKKRTLSPDEVSTLEAQLSNATDPNSVAIPPGYKVKVEQTERAAHVVPTELGLGPALSASLEILDGILDKAIGLHILQPIDVIETSLQLTQTDPSAGGPRKPTAQKPPAQQKKPAAAPSAADEAADDAHPQRAAARKAREEQERVKSDRESTEKLQKRQKENHAKLLEYQAKKQAKQAEKERAVEEEQEAKVAEEEKKKQREMKRNQKNKQKLADYKGAQADQQEAATADAPAAAAPVKEAPPAAAAPAVVPATAPAAEDTPQPAADTTPDVPDVAAEAVVAPAPEAEVPTEAEVPAAVAEESPAAPDEA